MLTLCKSLIPTTALAALILSPACATDTAPCTSDFRAITVTLVDTAAAPVADAIVASILLRTGDTLLASAVTSLDGTYVLVDDRSVGRIRSSGDSVTVNVRRATGPQFNARYIFDAPGGCHIRKVFGPDTLTVP